MQMKSHYDFIKNVLDKTIFKDDLNNELLLYLCNNYIPLYYKFDNGHNVFHCLAVTLRAIEYAEDVRENYKIDIDINKVIATSILHDIGISINRKGHAAFGAQIIKSDYNLYKFFEGYEIDIIANAVKEHSTSLRKMPNTIYGKIVSDADKDTDCNIYLIRSLKYVEKYFPEYTNKEIINDIFNDLNERFGKNGRVRFYLKNDTTNEYANKMSFLASNYQAFKKQMELVMLLNEISKDNSLEKIYMDSEGTTLEDKIKYLSTTKDSSDKQPAKTQLIVDERI